MFESGGRAFVLAFGEDALDGWGPNPVARSEFGEAFDEGWCVREVREEAFDTRTVTVPGYLAVVERDGSG